MSKDTPLAIDRSTMQQMLDEIMEEAAKGDRADHILATVLQNDVFVPFLQLVGDVRERASRENKKVRHMLRGVDVTPAFDVAWILTMSTALLDAALKYREKNFPRYEVYLEVALEPVPGGKKNQRNRVVYLVGNLKSAAPTSLGLDKLYADKALSNFREGVGMVGAMWTAVSQGQPSQKRIFSTANMTAAESQLRWLRLDTWMWAAVIKNACGGRLPILCDKGNGQCVVQLTPESGELNPVEMQAKMILLLSLEKMKSGNEGIPAK